MRNHKRNNGLLLLFISFIIVILLACIFWITWNDYYRKLITDPFYEKGSLLLTLVYIIQYFLFSNIYGGFKIGHLKTNDLIFSQSISIIFANVITYMQLSLLAKKLVIPNILLVMTVLDIIVVIIWSSLSTKIFFNIYPPINMLLIYKDSTVKNLISKMNNHKDKFNIESSINISEGLDLIKNEIDKHEAVIIYDIDSSVRSKIIKYCYKNSVAVYLIPKISDLIISSSQKIHIFDTPLLLSKSNGLTLEQRILKRILDVSLSSIAILIFLPFMIITAILIKLYDGGPIMYKQTRLTINNKTFEIYKFRSMIVNAEKNGEARLATQDDDRITPVGKIIRKIRFDELPQLFNILKGDMSIVGPRPERPDIAQLYMKAMPEFEFRTKVKAGLTGYAQVMGKYNTSPYDKLKLDLMYIGNYSTLLDLKLILMTIKILFKSESTEGVNVGELLPEFIAIDKNE